MSITTRPAIEKDAHTICNVLRRSIAECCIDDHHNDAALLEAWLRNKTPGNVAIWITSQSNFAVVAEAMGEVQGFGLMSHSGEIRMCYVLPEVRYTGVGKALLRAMENEAAGMEIDEMRLYSTGTGLSFYRRNGFQHNGEPQSFFGIMTYPCAKRISANTAVNAESTLATGLP